MIESDILEHLNTSSPTIRGSTIFITDAPVTAIYLHFMCTDKLVMKRAKPIIAARPY